MLLIKGKPGSGKSTFTKYFKDNLFKREPLAKETIVASFFHSRREGELHTNHSNMLRSILYDVLKKNEAFFYHFHSLHRKTLHGPWPYDSVIKILLSFKDHPTKERLYRIIDAMGESNNDRCEIFRLLHQLCYKRNHSFVKVFLASRPIGGPNQYDIEIKNIIKLQESKLDILKFAESFLAKLKLSLTCHRQTMDYIVQNAEGVFVWVYLVKQELLKYDETGCNEKEISDFLQSLPTELESIYEHILGRLENNEQRDIEVELRVIQLVLFTYHPLRFQEIQHALAIPGDSDVNNSLSNRSFERERINNIENRIIRRGGNLLDIQGPRCYLMNNFTIAWVTIYWK